jgi:hypothetical protein
MPRVLPHFYSGASRVSADIDVLGIRHDMTIQLQRTTGTARGTLRGLLAFDR